MANIDFQREFCGKLVPALYNWQGENDLTAALTWIAENNETIEKTLLETGAILFRGFPLDNADAFNIFVEQFNSLGYVDLPYEKSLSFAVRLPVVGRVCTTNEGKTGGMVFHHEQAQAPYFPSKLFFYCETPADSGGATAICPSDVVLQELESQFPDFVTACRDKGVCYTAILKDVPDSSIGVGRSWKSFFGRNTVEEVEARMSELGYTWEWLDLGTLKIKTPVLPAIRTIPGTSKEVFFNQMVAQIANARDFSGRDQGSDGAEKPLSEFLQDFLRFGDGSAVPAEPLEFAHRLCEDCAIELQWKAGDVALLDNYAVMHARRAFEGKRRVLASLVQ